MSGLKVGMFIFPDAEELDFVGPWEVFTVSAMVRNQGNAPEGDSYIIAETADPVRCNKGLRVTPDFAMADAPQPDILLIPGGMGTRPLVDNAPVIDWVAKTADKCTWVTSVCTGSFVLAKAGLTQGKRITTHWGAIDELKEIGGMGEVLENIRYVREGNLVTAAGVSAGIDMALWLVGELYGRDHARQTQRYMEYDPAPPYAAEA